MRIGTRLANIAKESNDIVRGQLIAEFHDVVEEHPEKKLLIECLHAACAGRNRISFGRNAVPPESLRAEGFHLIHNGYGVYEYVFS